MLATIVIVVLAASQIDISLVNLHKHYIYIPDQAASTNEYVQNFMDTLYTKYCHKINNYKMNWKNCIKCYGQKI